MSKPIYLELMLTAEDPGGRIYSQVAVTISENILKHPPRRVEEALQRAAVSAFDSLRKQLTSKE